MDIENHKLNIGCFYLNFSVDFENATTVEIPVQNLGETKNSPLPQKSQTFFWMNAQF